MQFYVHDYLIDYLGSTENAADPYCAIALMYSTSEQSSRDEELQQFSIDAGTPKGIARYLEIFSNQSNEDKQMRFFRPLVIVREFDEATLYQ